MKKKVLMSSIVTIALCLTLIAGSTYALFTDSDSVNVAVTSGTVDVVAVADNIVYGSVLVGGVLPESTAEFSPENNTVTIQYMVPGDYVEFDIVITNNSNVAVDYRPVVGLVEDGGLWSGLVVEYFDAEGNALALDADGAAAYADLPAGETTLKVRVSLPWDRGNEYQTKGCTFSYTVEAIQANAQ